MRFEGTLKSWNEAKGFGFLTPRQGGQDIFVHIKAFPRDSALPRVGEVFSFEVEQNGEGKKRAVRVRAAGMARAEPERASRDRGTVTRRRLGGFPVGILLLLVVVAVAVYGYSRLSASPVEDVPSMGLSATPAPAGHEPLQLPSPAFRCDGRTHCSQMSSCAEAKFFLANCPGVKMDGNNDGVPCESQWCTSPRAP